MLSGVVLYALMLGVASFSIAEKILTFEKEL
jgi:hypothetical protein